ncbi:MAG: hypothetical protein ACE5OZ_07170 [Candidatus Heimdallarchaeota archaeon]
MVGRLARLEKEGISIAQPDSNPSSSLFFSKTKKGQLLSKEWLLFCLNEADWRYRLLGGIVEFAISYFDSMESLGANYLIQTAQSLDKEELEIFLDAVGRLTQTHPLLVPQKESKHLYVLLVRS